MSNINEKLDRVFSSYIRLKYSDWKGQCVCYTCGRRMSFKQAQAGHFIGRGNEAVRWDERNVRVQCPYCNEVLEGNLIVFEEELRDELGKDTFNSLIKDSKGHYPDEEWKKEKFEHYKHELKQNSLYN